MSSRHCRPLVQVLVDSAQDPSYNLAAATAAVVFFGVPHFGSALAMKGSSNPLVNFIGGPLVKDLGLGNPRLIVLDQRFTDLPHAFTVNNLAESKPTVVNLGVSVSIPVGVSGGCECVPHPTLQA